MKLGGGESKDVKIWRLDLWEHRAQWDSGAGAAKVGGRWNPVGYPTVYCSTDAATAVLEVAVHKGFGVLDSVPHVMTRALILDAADVYVMGASDIPNPAWLHPGVPGAAQQVFGRSLMERHRFVLLPSSVLSDSWNLIFNPERAAGAYRLEGQRRLALDTRLNPPP